MRKAVLMVAFGVVAMCLLPKPARSLDDCVQCDCKEMKAWKNIDTGNVYGLRKKKVGDPTMTEPVEHVPDKDINAHLLSTATDAGVRTSQGVYYPIYQYTKTPDLDCKVAANESGYSKVRVTFKADDWEEFRTTNLEQQVHHLCKPKSKEE